jgi:hypothetical protein
MRRRTNVGKGFVLAVTFAGVGLAATNALAGTVTVNTTTGGFHNDNQCGLEEAVSVFESGNNAFGCSWNGAINNNTSDAIIIPTSGTFVVTTKLEIDYAATVRSSTANSLATIEAFQPGINLFGVDHAGGDAGFAGSAIIFQDLHLIGPGPDALPTSGINAQGGPGDSTDSLTATRCWIEQFSHSGIVVDDMGLNVTDSTIDSNSSVGDVGGGGIFFAINGPPAAFLTISNSAITRNFSDHAGGVQIQASGTALIQNSTISDNVAIGHVGGGISYDFDETINGGTLELLGSTVAFNATTLSNPGGGIANSQVGNSNAVEVIGSIVANNCMARSTGGATFTCISTNDFDGHVLLQDSLLGSTVNTTIDSRTGVVLTNVASGLSSTLTDKGGVGGNHPKVHALNSGSRAIDATRTLLTGNATDQTHHTRGKEPSGPSLFDFGAVENE